jgi:prolyl-tRNA synthetase
MYSKWVKSYRDLPILINQWGNVVRWEMRTRLFLRTLEFYWQEGHTAHATAEEAAHETLQMLEAYTDFAVNEAAVPVVPGLKSDRERFAGAVRSYTIEAMMGDTRALQAGTSHFLGQNFARAFDIQFLNWNNELDFAWTTSWGLSTRFVGAIIMTHGDDQGLVLPPRLAPIQVVIVPIYKSEEEKSRVMPVVQRVKSELSEFRVHVDDRSEVTPGFKFNHWELRGVPLRIEIGPKDVDKGTVAFARRDHPGKAGKSFHPQSQLATQVAEMLQAIQQSLYERALAFRNQNTYNPNNFNELVQSVQNGWALSWWCEDGECETRVKEEAKATTRCIPLAQEEGHGVCIVCGKPATKKVIFGRAY